MNVIIEDLIIKLIKSISPLKDWRNKFIESRINKTTANIRSITSRKNLGTSRPTKLFREYILNASIIIAFPIKTQYIYIGFLVSSNTIHIIGNETKIKEEITI